MRIAILSDSHDQVMYLKRAVQYINANGVEVLIHCGDLVSPFMLTQLQMFAGEAHLIYGNNIGDQHLIASRCALRGNNLRHHGIYGKITVDGLRIGFHHYPEVASDLAASGMFDIVCCGHNHICEVKKIGECFLINPGELLGKDTPPGFVILETRTMEVEHVIVGSPMDLTGDFAVRSNTLFENRT